jgi:translocation and assembly module TamB
MRFMGGGRARRLRRFILLVAVVVTASIAALPWVLGWPIVQQRLAAAANRILAPGRVEFRSLRLSWYRPTEITGLVLRDAQGDPVVSGPRAIFEWNLWQILTARPRSATLTIEQGSLDIERRADGTVDLYETLRPVISEHPPKRLIIRIPDGRLRFRDPLFPEPVIAEAANVWLDLGVDHEPIVWKIDLARTDAAGEACKLRITGRSSRADFDSKGRNDLTLALEGERWPWTLAGPGIESRGALSGTLSAERRAGRWLTAGDAGLTNLVAVGQLIGSDTIQLDQATAQWKIEIGDDAWTIEQLEVTSPVGSLKGHGSLPATPERSAWLDATVDLAAVARQLPATLRLRDDLRVERGAAHLRAVVRANSPDRTQDWSVTGEVSGLVARLSQKTVAVPEPATLRAMVRQGANNLTLERLEVQTSFLTARGEGDVDHGITVTGSIDLALFRERFRDWIDLGAIELAGRGKFEGRYQRRGHDFQAQANAAFEELRIEGLPLVGKVERNLLTLDGNVDGRASASGLPVDFKSASLRASSAPDELELKALADATSGDLTMSGRAQTDLNASGRRGRLVGDWNVSGNRRKWSADRLSLAWIPISEDGQARADGPAIRWAGTGRYDVQTDVLVVESAARPPEKRSGTDTWISGKQVLQVSGVQSLGAAQIEASAQFDLGSISPVLPTSDQKWSGQLDALLRARRDRDLWNLGLRVELNDAARLAGDGTRVSLGGDVDFGLTASYAPRSGLLNVTEMGLKAPYVQVDGAGSVRDLTGRPAVDLAGSINLDWKRLGVILAQDVEPRARISGRPRRWQLAGIIPSSPAVDNLGSLEGDFGVQIDALDIFGMRLSQTSLVARAANGRLSIDPIDATLNGGKLHVEPELVSGERGSIWLKLGRSTKLVGAVINDEVSHRVLSYAAPVLDGATRVEGRVSVELSQAAVPLLGAADAQGRAEGEVIFDDVRFMPGALADQLLSVFQKERKPLVVLRDRVGVLITDRKVYQQGLIIPVGELASIGIDGSVGFDKKLDLVARFALNPPRSPIPVLSPILETARFELPITGTLKKPKIDGSELKERWKAIGSGLLGNSMEAGVNGLQRLLQGLSAQPLPGLRPPGNPPNPQDRQRMQEERRRERLEKKADRRLRRSLPAE